MSRNLNRVRINRDNRHTLINLVDDIIEGIDGGEFNQVPQNIRDAADTYLTLKYEILALIVLLYRHVDDLNRIFPLLMELRLQTDELNTCCNIISWWFLTNFDLWSNDTHPTFS